MGNLVPPSAAHSKANAGASSTGNHPPLSHWDEEKPPTTANQGLAPYPRACVPTRTRPRAQLPNPTNGPNSPAEDHDEVHDVPAIAQIGALVENKPQSHNLNPSLEAENPDEVGLRLLLPEGNQ